MLGLAAMAMQAAIPAGTNGPASAWAVAYDPQNCTLSRSFGAGPAPASLIIDADPVSGEGDVVLRLPGVGGRSASGSAAIVDTATGLDLRTQWVKLTRQAGAGLFKVTVDRNAWRRILLADTLTITGIDADPVTIPVRGIAKAVEAVKACGRDLLTSWGADPRAIIDVPIERRITWFSPDDYPLDAFRRGQQGIVKVVATVGADGRPVACRTVVSSGVASLDEATCNALLRRARFEPSPVAVRYVYHRAIWINPN